MLRTGIAEALVSIFHLKHARRNPPNASRSLALLTSPYLDPRGCPVLCSLGDYDSSNLDDDRVYDPLSKFQKAIEEIGFDLASK